jgi:hypothetical protein
MCSSKIGLGSRRAEGPLASVFMVSAGSSGSVASEKKNDVLNSKPSTAKKKKKKRKDMGRAGRK